MKYFSIASKENTDQAPQGASGAIAQTVERCFNYLFHDPGSNPGGSIYSAVKKQVQPILHRIQEGGDPVKKPAGELYIRREDETEYRSWDRLSPEEIRRISTYLNLEAAEAGNFRQVAAG